MTELERMESAYLALLGMPHGEARLRLQAALAALRDTIAWRSGAFAQDIQDKYEAMVS